MLFSLSHLFRRDRGVLVLCPQSKMKIPRRRADCFFGAYTINRRSSEHRGARSTRAPNDVALSRFFEPGNERCIPRRTSLWSSVFPIVGRARPSGPETSAPSAGTALFRIPYLFALQTVQSVTIPQWFQKCESLVKISHPISFRLRWYLQICRRHLVVDCLVKFNRTDTD